MRKVRILVVDDSVVIRSALSAELSKEPFFEVAGVAADGKIALAKIPQINPDIILLDINMPVMGGLETLIAIRKSYSSLPVIMLSALTRPSAEATLDALSYGANDYVAKPENASDSRTAMQQVMGELIPKIKTSCSKILEKDEKEIDIGQIRLKLDGQVDIVVIGVSTGGPNALNDLLPRLPKNLPVPIVIVQHMPPVFTKLLAERLTKESQILVHEAVDGDCLQAGQAWIAPGGFHMVLEKATEGILLKINQEPPENSCRPSVDVLFRSAAALFGPKILAVVLTGMGEDGKRGCEEIVRRGGRVIVQDEATSVVWGMPGAVARAGLATAIFPLLQIPSYIEQVCQRPHERKR